MDALKPVVGRWSLVVGLNTRTPALEWSMGDCSWCGTHAGRTQGTAAYGTSGTRALPKN